MKQLVFNKDWSREIQLLSPKAQLEFWDIFMNYEYGDKIITKNKAIQIVWSNIKPKLDEYLKKDNEEGSESYDKNLLLIDMTEPLSFNPLHFYIAKSYHNFFLEVKGETKTLKSSKTGEYVDEIRKMLDIDKRTVGQLIAVKMYLEDGIKGRNGVRDFWSKTIYSIAALRKKSRNDGTYYWDRIADELKKWQHINGNTQRVLTAEAKLNELVNKWSSQN